MTRAAGVFVSDFVTNMKNMWMISADIQIAISKGMKLPDWATPELIDRIGRLRDKKLDTLANASPELVRIVGGTFLGHILDNFNQSRYASALSKETDTSVQKYKIMVRRTSMVSVTKVSEGFFL